MNILICLAAAALTYPIVDTGQALCYDDHDAIDSQKAEKPYYGQDAQ